MEILEFIYFTTLSNNLVIGNFYLQYESLCRFHFEPLSLRCEMTVMPLEWVLGHGISFFFSNL